MKLMYVEFYVPSLFFCVLLQTLAWPFYPVESISSFKHEKSWNKIVTTVQIWMHLSDLAENASKESDLEK